MVVLASTYESSCQTTRAPKSPERDYCELREVGSSTWFLPSLPPKIALLYLSFGGVGSWKQVKYYRVLVLGGRGEIICACVLRVGSIETRIYSAGCIMESTTG